VSLPARTCGIGLISSSSARYWQADHRARPGNQRRSGRAPELTQELTSAHTFLQTYCPVCTPCRTFLGTISLRVSRCNPVSSSPRGRGGLPPALDAAGAPSLVMASACLRFSRLHLPPHNDPPSDPSRRRQPAAPSQPQDWSP